MAYINGKQIMNAEVNITRDGNGVEILRDMQVVQFVNLNNLGGSDVVLNLDNVTSLQKFYSSPTEKNTTVENLTINCPNLISSLYGFCYGYANTANADNKIKKITLNIDMSETTNFTYAFAYLNALEEIAGNPLDLSSCTSQGQVTNVFAYNTALKEVRFVANSISFAMSLKQSPALSGKSTTSIINGLADLTGGTAETLTLHETVGESLTDAQKAIISNKNWTLVY